MTTLDRLAAKRNQSLPQLVQQLGKGVGLVQQQVDAVSGRRVLVGGQWLINFTSSDYLGLAGHPSVRQAASHAARKWGTSLSQPRLWATDRLTAKLEQKLACFVGQERALVFPSTMQIAHDVLPILAGSRGVILVDEFAYPISRRAALAAAQSGVAVKYFQHNNPDHLAHILRKLPLSQDKVVVCDGVYMATGEIAALAAFAELAGRYNATIYLDDAQGTGLLGRAPTRHLPYGSGGGGTPTYCRVRPGRIAHVSTLAKALGVPLAFIAGPAHFIEYLRSSAFSQIHCSPPALPLLAAALAAIQVNAVAGDQLRQRLLLQLQTYWSGIGPHGNRSSLLLPMQTIYFSTSRETMTAGAQLRECGIWPVIQLNPEDNPVGGALRFLFTAVHNVDDMRALLFALDEVQQTGDRRRLFVQ